MPDQPLLKVSLLCALVSLALVLLWTFYAGAYQKLFLELSLIRFIC
ncbi:hypothetical protein ABVF61_04735 [Roseibium sp. HPY-6]